MPEPTASSMLATPSLATPSTLGADPALMRIIRQVESGNRSDAIRFEPTVFSGWAGESSEQGFVQRIADINHCDFDTAKVLFSTSFGLYQLMGFNIYSLGFVRPIVEFWSDHTLQDIYFHKFLIKNNINIPWSTLKSNPELLAHFASVYNGPGGRVTYAAAMTRAATGLGL
jgi:hypothetical protein